MNKVLKKSGKKKVPAGPARSPSADAGWSSGAPESIAKVPESAEV